MPISVIFKLREPQKGISPAKQKETPIIMYFNFGYYEITSSGAKKYIPMKYGSGEKIFPYLWKDKPDYRAKQSSKFDHGNFNTRLDNLENLAKLKYREQVNKGIEITPRLLKDLLDEELGKKAKKIMYTLNAYIKKYLDEIKNGERLTEKKTMFTGSTVTSIRAFQTQLDLYQKERRKKLNYDDITIDFYNDIIQFFNDKDYRLSTIGKHIKTLKTLMKASKEEGFHSSSEFERRAFKAPSYESYNIYLTEKELQKLYQQDLSDSPHWELARDVFLIGCYTAQRFSDYSKIKKENVKTLEKGKKVLELVQKKTREKVIIPLKVEAEIILKKYDYSLPKTYEQKVNDYIKKVGAKVKINEPVHVESIKGGMRIKKTIPKHDLIKTHTARRSGCTNMYLADISVIDIMKISGHKTEREFLKYIKITKEETAKNLINHPYFASSNLRIAK